MIYSSKSSPILNDTHKLTETTSKLQSYDINLSLVHLLTQEIKDLKGCQIKIHKLQHIANSDVDNLMDTLFHNLDDIDKQMYKTGVKFMKQTISCILSE